MDKDIVREAWVAGDLKDRLGLKSRGSTRGKKTGDPEDLSLFRPHVRDTSDTSELGRGDYEPVAPGSADRSPNPAVETTLHDEETTQYATRTPTSLQPDPRRSPPPKSPATPNTYRMSYYSASEIPRGTPSPLGPPTPTTAQTPHSGDQLRPPSRNPYHSPTSTPTTTLHPGLDRGPPSSTSTLGFHTQDPSAASGYVTASDGGWDSDEDNQTVRQPHDNTSPNRQSYYAGGQAM